MCVCERELAVRNAGMNRQHLPSPWKLCQHMGAGWGEREGVYMRWGGWLFVCDLLLGRRYLTLLLRKSLSCFRFPSRRHREMGREMDFRAVRSFSDSLSSSVAVHSVDLKKKHSPQKHKECSTHSKTDRRKSKNWLDRQNHDCTFIKNLMPSL